MRLHSAPRRPGAFQATLPRLLAGLLLCQLLSLPSSMHAIAQQPTGLAPDASDPASTEASIGGVRQAGVEAWGLALEGAPGAALALETVLQVEVTGLVARVLVLQAFRNDSQAWVEGLYRFPLPDHPMFSMSVTMERSGTVLPTIRMPFRLLWTLLETSPAKQRVRLCSSLLASTV